jgi:hypothetical protein
MSKLMMFSIVASILFAGTGALKPQVADSPTLEDMKPSEVSRVEESRMITAVDNVLNSMDEAEAKDPYTDNYTEDNYITGPWNTSLRTSWPYPPTYKSPIIPLPEECKDWGYLGIARPAYVGEGAQRRKTNFKICGFGDKWCWRSWGAIFAMQEVMKDCVHVNHIGMGEFEPLKECWAKYKTPETSWFLDHLILRVITKLLGTTTTTTTTIPVDHTGFCCFGGTPCGKCDTFNSKKAAALGSSACVNEDACTGACKGFFPASHWCLD